MRRHSNDEGEVVMVTEHRILDAFSERQGQVVIRGSPERLLEYLVEDHSVVDPTYVEVGPGVVVVHLLLNEC